MDQAPVWFECRSCSERGLV